MGRTDFEMAWDYIRFGNAGIFVENDENGRGIERVSDYVNTLSPRCACYEFTAYGAKRAEGYRYGKEAVEWLLGM